MLLVVLAEVLEVFVQIHRRKLHTLLLGTITPALVQKDPEFCQGWDTPGVYSSAFTLLLPLPWHLLWLLRDVPSFAPTHHHSCTMAGKGVFTNVWSNFLHHIIPKPPLGCPHPIGSTAGSLLSSQVSLSLSIAGSETQHPNPHTLCLVPFNPLLSSLLFLMLSWFPQHAAHLSKETPDKGADVVFVALLQVLPGLRWCSCWQFFIPLLFPSTGFHWTLVIKDLGLCLRALWIRKESVKIQSGVVSPPSFPPLVPIPALYDSW